MVPEFGKLLPDQSTRHIPVNKAKNIEEFIRSASGKPDPVPISAYVPGTQPVTDFLCSFDL